MKKRKNLAQIVGFCALVAISVTSCTKKSENTLYLYNWAVYTPDSVIQKFEKEFNCKVVYDDFASNEDMYAKLKAGGSGYDLIVPSGDYVAIMKAQNMLEPIDLSKIPNTKYIYPEVFAKASYDPTMEVSVPYYMGAAGIAVNTEKVPNFQKSWSIFSRKDLAGRMSMLDDMREVLGDALAYLGYSVNTANQEELDKAYKLVNNEWKPNLVKFDAEGFGKAFASGEFWVVQGYAETVYGEISESMKNKVAFFIPKEEGGPMYIDSLCIPKGAKNATLAHEFINFFLRPEIYAEFLDSFGFPATIHSEAGALMERQPFYTPEELVNCELKDDLGENLDMYNNVWQKIRFTE